MDPIYGSVALDIHQSLALIRIHVCAHVHTHTHTYLYRPSTVDFFFLQEFYTQPWTYTSEFSRITMDFVCVCVCVCVCEF